MEQNITYNIEGNLSKYQKYYFHFLNILKLLKYNVEYFNTDLIFWDEDKYEVYIGKDNFCARVEVEYDKTYLTTIFDGILEKYEVNETLLYFLEKTLWQNINYSFSNIDIINTLYTAYKNFIFYIEQNPICFASISSYYISSIKFISDKRFDKEFIDEYLIKNKRDNTRLLKYWNNKNDPKTCIICKIPTTLLIPPIPSLFELKLVSCPTLYDIFTDFSDIIDLGKKLKESSSKEISLKDKNFIFFGKDIIETNHLKNKLLELGYIKAIFRCFKKTGGYIEGLIDYIE